MKIHTRQSGFTLLELLLVVGISAVLLLGMVKVSDLWVSAMKAEQAGQHIEMVRRAADEFLHSQSPDFLIANAGDITNLTEFTDFLPNRGDSLTSPLGINRTTNVRMIFNNAGGTPKFEVFINTIGPPIPNKLLVSAANAVGAFGGMISNIFPGGTTARSPYGTWDLPPGSFLVDPSDVDNDGGQLAAYYAVTSQDIFGPYLYRMEVGGDPIYNTMDADLLMNGNSIIGANQVWSQVMNVTSDATVTGTLIGTNATFDGDLTINGPTLTIAGNAQIDGTLDVQNNATITGIAAVDRLDAMTATTGTINAGEVDVETLNLSSNALVQAEAFAISTAVSGIRVSGTLESRNITSDLATVNDALYTGDLEVVGGGASVSGNVDLGGTVRALDMVVNRCLTLNGTGYGDCF